MIGPGAYSQDNTREAASLLLAVDAGLKSGLAWFDGAGRLVACRSTNFGSRERLRRGAVSVLRERGPLEVLVVEGGGVLAKVWQRAGQRMGLPVLTVSAETWRQDLLLPRQQVSGSEAKATAQGLAKGVARACGLSKPTALNHDAAEAVCIGLWACLDLGRLDPEYLERLGVAGSAKQPGRKD